MGCLGYMVTKKYVMGCLPDTSSMGVCDGMPRIYDYKMVCDGMPRIYGYKGVCDGMPPLIRIHYPSDRLYFHSSIAVIRHQSQFDRHHPTPLPPASAYSPSLISAFTIKAYAYV